MAVTGMTWEEANRQVTAEIDAQNNQNQIQTFGFNTGMFNSQQNNQSFTDYVNSLPIQQEDNSLNSVYRNMFGSEDEFIQERMGAYGVDEQQARQEWQNLLLNPTSVSPTVSNDNTSTNKTTFRDIFQNGVPLVYGGGTSSEQEAYQFGRFAGMERGTQGRGVGMVASGLALGLGTTRNLLSGLSFSRQNQQVYDDAQRIMMGRNYSPNPQYRDQNSFGGFSVNKMGGNIKLKPKTK